MQVREVAVRWGSSVAQYEVQTSSNGVHWTAVAAASGIAGELVRTALPETAAAQWIRIACSSLSPSSSCIIQELYVYDVAGQSGPETTASTAPSAPTTAPTTAEPTTAPMENIALLKPVLSSSQVLPNNFAARAVDGLETTQWTSAPGEQWIWVDLLGRYDLDHVDHPLPKRLLQDFSLYNVSRFFFGKKVCSAGTGLPNRFHVSLHSCYKYREQT